MAQQIITRFSDGSALIYEFKDHVVDEFALELMARGYSPKNVQYIDIPEAH